MHFTVLLLYNIKKELVVGWGGIVHKDNGSDISTPAGIVGLTFFWMVMFSLASSSCDSWLNSFWISWRCRSSSSSFLKSKSTTTILINTMCMCKWFSGNDKVVMYRSGFPPGLFLDLYTKQCKLKVHTCTGWHLQCASTFLLRKNLGTLTTVISKIL